MFNKKKRSFFEKITGGIRLEDEELAEPVSPLGQKGERLGNPAWATDESEEGQLSVDVYQTATDIVIQTMVAGVRTEDLQINITRDLVTIKGKREENKAIADDNFFIRELYWGSFSRTISLPQEVEPEEAEAIERHGLLMIRLPKIDKGRKTLLRIKSV